MPKRHLTATGPVLDSTNRPLQVTGPSWRAKRRLGKVGHSACISLMTMRVVGTAHIAPSAPRATPSTPPIPGLPVTKTLPAPLPHDQRAADRLALLLARRKVMLRRWCQLIQLLLDQDVAFGGIPSPF